MSEMTQRSALATVEAFESAAFRVASVARQLLAEYPGLPVWEINPLVSARRSGHGSARLELILWTVEDLQAWSKALGVTAAVRFFDSKDSAHAFESHQATQAIAGVEVILTATRRPTEHEITGWRGRAAVELVKASTDEGDVR